MELPKNPVTVSYFDVHTATCHDCTAIIAESFVLHKSRGETLAIDYSQMVQRSAGDGTICLSFRHGGEGARLYIDNTGLSDSDKIWLQNIPLFNSGLSAAGIKQRAIIIAAALGIVGSLVLTFTYLIPASADHITKIIPYKIEQTLGRRIESSLLSKKETEVCRSPLATDAIQKIETTLARAGELDEPLKLQVVELPMANALALPGGTVLVTTQLLELLENEEQLLGVLAHEIGHVKARHSMGIAVRVGASSAMAGFLFGDFAGAGAVIAMGQVLLSTSYSRELEREADTDAIAIMQDLGIEPTILSQVLGKLSDASVKLPAMFSTHPLTEERIFNLNSAAGSKKLTKNPLLSPEEWRHLASGCS